MKDILQYLPSKILPGIFSILTISLLTRALATEEFGRYSYMLALGGLITVSCFSWLTLAVNRHYFDKNNRVNAKVKGTALFFNLLLFFFGIVIFLLAYFYLNLEQVYLLVFLVGWLNGLFDLLLQASILESKKKIYSFSVLVRPSLLLLSALLAFYSVSLGVEQLLIVIIISYVLACLFLFSTSWKGISLESWNKGHVRDFIQYGIPLTFNFGLMYVVSSSDKLLISFFLTDELVGIYSASYDLFSQIVFGFGNVLTLVLFPRLLKAYNVGGNSFIITFQQNVKTACVYLFIIILLLSALTPFVIDYALAANYHSFASEHYITIIFMTAIYCVYSYVFVPVLQLKKQVKKIMNCSLVMALTNVSINIIFLENFGIKISIYSTLAAYVVGFILCIFYTKDVWMLILSKDIRNNA